MDEDGQGSVSFWLQGSSKFDSVRGRLFAVLLFRTANVANGCPPSYLMRDRHRRHILNRLCHLKRIRASTKGRCVSFLILRPYLFEPSFDSNFLAKFLRRRLIV